MEARCDRCAELDQDVLSNMRPATFVEREATLREQSECPGERVFICSECHARWYWSAGGHWSRAPLR